MARKKIDGVQQMVREADARSRATHEVLTGLLRALVKHQVMSSTDCLAIIREVSVALAKRMRTRSGPADNDALRMLYTDHDMLRAQLARDA